ncbi:spermidine synthase-like [Copidosoma floridanum]|uniref:spermidine synthase-like n=1 Tax=Copidosoma floridanum TaxID=29053 RepID=UPI0006C99814|nr:spermidine synthase-like [Copidosoma floridanum]XP_014215879.1 spermidine synthase-like [Copidosoma floridanum]XP_014215880.1 spermidine synthase-like [Copidosoma floridanum]
MDALKNGWFSEINDLWPGISQSLEVEEVLYNGHSKYQHILVLQTKSYGKALVLDGIIQCTEKDEFSYQEMISFLPLCSHPNPKTVLIVGGGDGGVAREVAKFPKIEKVYQVEIDEKVVEVSRKYLQFMATGYDHPKVELVIGDGYKFVEEHKHSFDVIITDSSDPIGPATCLFEEPYFVRMKNALKPGGIICTQAGTYWSNLDQIKRTLNHCKDTFPKVGYAISSVPTYPTGQIGYMMGSLDETINFREPKTVFTDAELDKMNMRYYSDRVHRASFELPRFVEKELDL